MKENDMVEMLNLSSVEVSSGTYIWCLASVFKHTSVVDDSPSPSVQHFGLDWIAMTFQIDIRGSQIMNTNDFKDFSTTNISFTSGHL